MKPVYYLSALFLVGTVTVAAQGTRGAPLPPPPSARPAQSSATMDKAAMETALLASEQKLNEAVAKGSLTAFRALVADGGWSVDQGGQMSVLDFAKSLSQLKIEPGWAVTDSRVVWIDTSSAVVTYKWTGKGSMAGQPLPPVVFASTVWTKRGGKWVAVFHQESTALAGK
jgi:hypothetical protein